MSFDENEAKKKKQKCFINKDLISILILEESDKRLQFHDFYFHINRAKLIGPVNYKKAII